MSTLKISLATSRLSSVINPASSSPSSKLQISTPSSSISQVFSGQTTCSSSSYSQVRVVHSGTPSASRMEQSSHRGTPSSSSSQLSAYRPLSFTALGFRYLRRLLLAASSPSVVTAAFGSSIGVLSRNGGTCIGSVNAITIRPSNDRSSGVIVLGYSLSYAYGSVALYYAASPFSSSNAAIASKKASSLTVSFQSAWRGSITATA